MGAERRPQPLDAQRILEELTRHGVEYVLVGGMAAPYPELRKRALVISIDEATVPVAGRDDLIRMKLARGRPVDRADVAALTAGAESPEPDSNR